MRDRRGRLGRKARCRRAGVGGGVAHLAVCMCRWCVALGGLDGGKGGGAERGGAELEVGGRAMTQGGDWIGVPGQAGAGPRRSAGVAARARKCPV